VTQSLQRAQIIGHVAELLDHFGIAESPIAGSSVRLKGIAPTFPLRTTMLPRASPAQD
jgi:hypothetical protein